jgi:hypothetical protein
MQTHAPRRSRAYAVLLRFSLPILVLVSIYAASLHGMPNESIFDAEYGFGPAINGIVKQHRLGANRPELWLVVLCGPDAACARTRSPQLSAVTKDGSLFIAEKFSLLVASTPEIPHMRGTKPIP